MKGGEFRSFWDYLALKTENMQHNGAIRAGLAAIDCLPTLSPTGS